MPITQNSNFRLPEQIKSKLRTISALDDVSATTTLKRLINSEYKARRDEIQEFRKNLKNNEIVRKTEQIKE